MYYPAVKEEDQSVMDVNNLNSSLEIPNSAPIYAGGLIAFSCVLFIIILFLLMFGIKTKR